MILDDDDDDDDECSFRFLLAHLFWNLDTEISFVIYELITKDTLVQTQEICSSRPAVKVPLPIQFEQLESSVKNKT